MCLDAVIQTYARAMQAVKDERDRLRIEVAQLRAELAKVAEKR